MAPISAAGKLRALLKEEEIIVCPGVYDGFTARITLAEGFNCLYMVFRFHTQAITARVPRGANWLTPAQDRCRDDHVQAGHA